jgi:hypothetical protein
MATTGCCRNEVTAMCDVLRKLRDVDDAIPERELPCVKLLTGRWMSTA